MERKGDAELAASQREAMRRRRETEQIMSRGRAVAAASGGGAQDESVTSILSKVQQEGDYNAQMDMYNGIVSRADLYKEAAVARTEGKRKFFSSFIDAGSTVYGDMREKKRLRLEYSR
jgi:hypothetical protein